MDERVVLSVAETAEALGKSVQWVRKRIHSGDIPHKWVGPTLLVPRAWVDQLGAVDAGDPR